MLNNRNRFLLICILRKSKSRIIVLRRVTACLLLAAFLAQLHVLVPSQALDLSRALVVVDAVDVMNKKAR